MSPLHPPKKKTGYIVNPGICKWDLIWKQGLCKCDQVKIRSHWMRLGSNPMTDVLRKTGRFGPGHRGMERVHMKTEERFGVMSRTASHEQKLGETREEF